MESLPDEESGATAKTVFVGTNKYPVPSEIISSVFAEQSFQEKSEATDLTGSYNPFQRI
jgi:hypothetical protein